MSSQILSRFYQQVIYYEKKANRLTNENIPIALDLLADVSFRLASMWFFTFHVFAFNEQARERKKDIQAYDFTL
jgi:hypothetical protein